MVDVVTDAQIAQLKALPKTLVNPGARPRPSERFVRHEYRVESLDGQHAFHIYKRQNLIDPDDFSTGIRWQDRRTEITLALREIDPPLSATCIKPQNITS